MRVIAGKARHLKLKTVEGLGTRPTTDRIKETLFNMITPMVPGASFLDLFSGSGGIGIEALSRGASCAVFVENNRRAVSCIRDNLHHTQMEDQAQVMARDVFSALSLLEEEKRRFDLIFMDPPYGKGWEKRVLTFLAASPLCDEDTVIIAESDLLTEYSFLEGTALSVTKEKIYKTNKHTFIKKDAAG